ncbi:MAG: T9SS type A sorting domain-containing protein [Bacteroidetes bacterium]|nr:T9SS type A sorting domain-containing protein [Bacteroidota bacterium]
MKRKILLTLGIVASTLLASPSMAQYANQIMGPRLIVDAPSSLAGVKAFTYSSNTAMTGPWGRALDSVWLNVEVVKAAPDITACGTINTVSGKWVIIMRGDCEFGLKALNAQNKGAKGVIIVNQHAGEGPVGMGAGASGSSVTIPVLMVSNIDGLAMLAALNNGQQLFISLAKWGFGNANDLALVPTSTACGPYGAVPLSQFASGSPAAYRYYTGAYVANTGTHKATNVMVKNNITFTPVGGSAASVYTDSSIATGNFNPTDSIIEVFSPRTTSFSPTQLGTYTLNYSVSSDSTDQHPTDNTLTNTVDITANVFCKGRIDPVTQNPKASVFYRLNNNTSGFIWGPLIYVNKGNYKADFVKLAVYDGDTSKHSLNGNTLAVRIMKWVDGSNSQPLDGIIEEKELTLKSIAGRALTNADSNQQMMNLYCFDATGISGQFVTEDDSWYWLAVELPYTSNLWSLGCDGESNYFNRTKAGQDFATTKFSDYASPMYSNSYDAFIQTTDSVRMIAFGAAGNRNASIADSADFTQSRGSVPAVALFVSPFNVGVNTAKPAGEISLYPNPATEVVNAKISLANNTSVASIKVIDALGRTVYNEERKNFQQGEISVSVKGFAPGNYHLIVVGDMGAIYKQFTVASK